MAFAQDHPDAGLLFKHSARSSFHSSCQEPGASLGSAALPKMYLPFSEGLPPAYNAYDAFDEGKPSLAAASCRTPALLSRLADHVGAEMGGPKLTMVKEVSSSRRRGACFVFCCCGAVLVALVVAVVSLL